MLRLPHSRMPLEQYLELEDRSETRHEYFAGETFEVEAVSYRHQKIGSQLLRALHPAVLAKGCEMLFSGTRVATSKEGLYTYPDLVIVCGRPEFWQADPNALSNPKVIRDPLAEFRRLRPRRQVRAISDDPFLIGIPHRPPGRAFRRAPWQATGRFVGAT